MPFERLDFGAWEFCEGWEDEREMVKPSGRVDGTGAVSWWMEGTELGGDGDGGGVGC